ncbi:MAG: hypothetical protein V4440_03835 [Pseudomonadota bacterium]
MIETRPLTRVELNLLIAEAPEDETRNLLAYCKINNIDVYDFINQNSVYKFGLVIDKRPIYFAHVKDKQYGYEIWTVVNSDVSQQKTLYKYSKLAVQEALKKFSPIHATMEKHLHKNLKWTERMGFKRIHEDDRIVTLKIGE